MPVTIYEIAELAGVSSSTVARILRGDVKESHRRSAETAKRIRRLAREMGYRTNLRARAFSRGRTHGIGLLYTDDAWIFEGMNTQVVNSLVRSLQRSKYHLVFAPIDASGAWEEIVLGGQIDGGVVFQSLPHFKSESCRWCCWATTQTPQFPRLLSTMWPGRMPPQSIYWAWAISASCFSSMIQLSRTAALQND
jgi:LacI family transcriptional regulator